ncbi:MAG TPA: hypothetical protein VF522_19065 [Ramlibacter sp.]|uniref:terminase small subunit-like protein n=1 Tax=Ramlibacter sp. TaxID=1917967 RepID=UPI002ED345A8
MDEERALIVLASMESGMSLRQACEHADVPPGTFLGWCDTDPDLAEHYARARVRLLDMKAEELEDIGERAARAKTAVEVAGLRLQSDNRKWLLSKLVPKKYGEKVAIGGAEDLPPVRAALDVSTLSTQALAEIMRAKDAAQRG